MADEGMGVLFYSTWYEPTGSRGHFNGFSYAAVLLLFFLHTLCFSRFILYILFLREPRVASDARPLKLYWLL